MDDPSGKLLMAAGAERDPQAEAQSPPGWRSPIHIRNQLEHPLTSIAQRDLYSARLHAPGTCGVQEAEDCRS